MGPKRAPSLKILFGRGWGLPWLLDSYVIFEGNLWLILVIKLLLLLLVCESPSLLASNVLPFIFTEACNNLLSDF